MEKLALIFIFSFLIGEDARFIITFMGVNSASVLISEKDTLINGENAKSIQFETHTISGAKVLFPVDNYYHTIINNDFNQILYFNKRTSQPWLKNNISTINRNNKIIYENTEIEIKKGYQNIFTLLQYLNHVSIKEVQENKFLIDREGKRYNAQFEFSHSNEVYDEFQLILKPIISIKNSSIVEGTDIFTWAVFKENAERILRINKNNGKLIYCKFSTGFISMQANLVEN
jgi:hypothetical protein